MKRILFAIVLGMIALSAIGQEKAYFLEDEPWEKVLKQAKKTDKLIFVDCYTQWCGPCKILMNKIFPQKEVHDYMDEKFVCVKYDMEKEEGEKFLKLYPDIIYGYPTLLVISSEGEILHRMLGARTAEELLGGIEDGLAGNSIYIMGKEYQQGNRDKDFIQKYLYLLINSHESEKYQEVAYDYFSHFPIDSLLNKEVWDIMSPCVFANPYNREFRFVLEHLYDFQFRGWDRYDLESRIYFTMKSHAVSLSSAIPTTENRDSLERKIDQIIELAKYSVKGFPTILAEAMLDKALLSNNVEKVYERFVAFSDCNFISKSPAYVAFIYRYLFENLTDKQRIQNCMDELLALQEAGGIKDLDKIIALGKEKLGNME